MVLLSKLAIIEAGSPDKIVTLSNVAEGGEGATRQGFSIEPVENVIENEQLYWAKADYSLQIAGLKGSSADKTQLDTWTKNETDLIFSGYGTGVIFQGRGKLNVDPGLGENVATWRIESAKRAVRGYGTDGRAHSQMILSENGFNEYLWGDADSDGIADGWSKVGTGTASFSGGAQTLQADENTLSIEREVYFPFTKDITFFANVTAYTSASNLTRRLEMEYLNASGTTISTDSDTFTGTGVKSVTNTPPDGTHSIKFRVEITETGTGAADMTFKDVGFRIDGSTEYIEQ